MISFIFGDDSYRVKTAVKEVVAAWGKTWEKSHHLSINDNSEDPVRDLAGAIKGRSLFDAHLVVLAANFVFDKKNNKIVQEAIVNSRVLKDENIQLVISENKPRKDLLIANKDLFNFLTKQGNSKELNKLSDAEAVSWVKDESLRRGLKISSGLVRELVSIVGKDSHSLSSEIDKLSNYCQGQEARKEDLNTVSANTLELNIFDLVDALSLRDKNRAYQLSYVALKLNNDPVQLLRPIIYQFRNLVTMKDYLNTQPSGRGADKVLGIHPFVAQKTISQCQKFTSDDLKKAYGKLADMDIQIKSGLIDPGLALDYFILSL